MQSDASGDSSHLFPLLLIVYRRFTASLWTLKSLHCWPQLFLLIRSQYFSNKFWNWYPLSCHGLWFHFYRIDNVTLYVFLHFPKNKQFSSKALSHLYFILRFNFFLLHSFFNRDSIVTLIQLRRIPKRWQLQFFSFLLDQLVITPFNRYTDIV